VSAKEIRDLVAQKSKNATFSPQGWNCLFYLISETFTLIVSTAHEFLSASKKKQITAEMILFAINNRVGHCSKNLARALVVRVNKTMQAIGDDTVNDNDNDEGGDAAAIDNDDTMNDDGSSKTKKSKKATQIEQSSEEESDNDDDDDDDDDDENSSESEEEEQQTKPKGKAARKTRKAN